MERDEVSASLSAVPPEVPEVPEKRVGSIVEQRRRRQEARRNEALTYKLAGLSNTQIADRLGISESGVKDLLNRTLARETNRAVEELRDLENARLDRAQAAIWGEVLKGDLKAVDTFLRLSARRSRLNGLDAPTNINLSVSVRQEMENALVELQRVVLGEVVDDERAAIEP